MYESPEADMEDGTYGLAYNIFVKNDGKLSWEEAFSKAQAEIKSKTAKRWYKRPYSKQGVWFFSQELQRL